jgi:hypothetical protein
MAEMLELVIKNGFGVVCGAVIIWIVIQQRKTIDNFEKALDRAIWKFSEQIDKQREECRQERLGFDKERDKERETRHSLGERMHLLQQAVESHMRATNHDK